MSEEAHGGRDAFCEYIFFYSSLLISMRFFKLLTCRCQREFQSLRCVSPVDGCYKSLTLIPKTEESQRVGGGVERVVVAIEERSLLASQLAQGSEPHFHSNMLFPLSL